MCLPPQRRTYHPQVTGLSCLDLEDLGTQQRLQPALQHLVHLMCSWHRHSFSPAESKAGPQWARLQNLLLDFKGEAQSTRAELLEVPAADRRCGEYGHRSTIGGVYRPSPGIQALRFVRKVDRVYLLRCTSCGKQLLSQWVFAHRDPPRILKPFNGHQQCGRYESVEGLPCQNDRKDHLDVCVHDKREEDCPVCGGRLICKHQRIRRGCRLCRAEGLVQVCAKKKS